MKKAAIFVFVTVLMATSFGIGVRDVIAASEAEGTEPFAAVEDVTDVPQDDLPDPAPDEVFQSENPTTGRINWPMTIVVSLLVIGVSMCIRRDD